MPVETQGFPCCMLSARDELTKTIKDRILAGSMNAVHVLVLFTIAANASYPLSFFLHPVAIAGIALCESFPATWCRQAVRRGKSLGTPPFTTTIDRFSTRIQHPAKATVHPGL